MRNVETSQKSNQGRLADLVARRLRKDRSALREYWEKSQPVRHCFVDDLFPPEIVQQLADEFPAPTQLMQRNTIRERKRVGVSLESYKPSVGDALLAFQAPAVVAEVEAITGTIGMQPDPSLYASGISYMGKGDFLNPHLDNSHDGDGELYRVLNLLYYAGPDWRLENGGNLELWEKGPSNGHTIVSAFNRLVLMATDCSSWHSVSPVEADQPRLCFSNYYFTLASPESVSYQHVTTFAGRPEEKVKGMVLRVDGIARNAVKRMFPGVGRGTAHRRNSGEAPSKS